jgi:hypothetical protein
LVGIKIETLMRTRRADVDITYVGKSEGDYFDLFHFMADGDRPVLEILVSPDNKIWVAGMTGLSIPQETKGTVHRHKDDEFEAVGIDTEHVCLGSIAGYVVPRIATLMARVYCPAQHAEKES